MTIHRESGGLLVTMNRDEAISRAPEIPPAIHAEDGSAAWMAPQDSAKGGTWMGANECGVVACLLNYYRPGESLIPQPQQGDRSRGEIIPRMLTVGGLDQGTTWLEESFDPEPYPSFTLLLFTLASGRRITWLRGTSLRYDTIEGTWSVISSSGWDSERIIRWREERFQQWLADGETMQGTLPSFNVLQVPGKEEWSPLMKRDWSSTRSVTQAAVDPSKALLHYWPDPAPNSVEPSTSLALNLVQPAGKE